jgi:hypothetical protein
MILALSLLLAASPGRALGRGRTHQVSFGRSMTVQLFLGADEKSSVPIKVRALYTDGKLAEFTTGELHTLTDQLFVVRRVLRINNNLPAEKVVGNWLWQKSGWLLVDRQKAHVTELPLALFDPYYSQASWFRDYAAYCGVSDNGEKLYAVIVQVGRKRPVFRKMLGDAQHGPDPSANCGEPQWEKAPVRVAFLPAQGGKLTVQVFEHTAGESSAEEKPSAPDSAPAPAPPLPNAAPAGATPAAAPAPARPAP